MSDRRSAAFSRLGPRDWLVGAVVLLAYLVVQLVLLRGPRPFDPAIYFRAGIDFPDVDGTLWTLRIGLVAPVRAAVALLGPSEAALYAVPFFAGLLLTGSAYVTTIVLFGARTVAAAAALVVALNPYVLLNSSFLFPDTLAAATLAAAFTCLVCGAAAREAGDTRPAAAFVALAGVLLGWTYLVREFSALLVPAFAAVVALLRYRARHLALLAGATLATLALEPLYGLARYGQPFVHLRLLLVHRPEARVRAPLERRIEAIERHTDTLVETAAVFPRLLLSWRVGWIYLALVLLFLLGLAWRRDRRLWLLAPWFFGFWAVMAIVGLVTLPSGRWLLNVTNLRYWYPIFPPLVLGAFGTLALLTRSTRTFRGIAPVHVLAPGMAALALLPGIAEYRRCAAADVWPGQPRAPWHELRSWLATPEAARFTTIRADANTHRYLPAFTRTTFGDPVWRGSVTRLRPKLARRPTATTLVLLDRRTFRSEATLATLRREWSPVFTSGDGMIVALAARSVARAPEGEAEWWELPPTRRATEGCGVNPYER